MDEFFHERKLKKILWIASLLVAYSGLIGFTCFIFEETLQLQTFTAFIYTNSEDWEGLSEHIKFMEDTQTFAGVWIKCFGWGNPIMYPAFLSYLKSNEHYIKALKSKVEKEKG